MGPWVLWPRRGLLWPPNIPALVSTASVVPALWLVLYWREVPPRPSNKAIICITRVGIEAVVRSLVSAALVHGDPHRR